MKDFIIIIINVVITIAEFLLGIRLLLRLLGASANSQFVSWIYEASAPLIAPFSGIFPNPTLAGRFVLEFSTIFAIIVYAFVRFLVVEFLDATHKR